MESGGFMDSGQKPVIAEIIEYVGTAKGHWQELTAFLEEQYKISPKMTYSKCSAKPGWNVRYHKSGKSLCTLYPDRDYFTVLVVVSEKETDQIKIRLDAFGQYFAEVFKTAGSLNGCRWLMLEVRDKVTLDDVKEAIMLKLKPKGLSNKPAIAT